MQQSQQRWSHDVEPRRGTYKKASQAQNGLGCMTNNVTWFMPVYPVVPHALCAVRVHDDLLSVYLLPQHVWRQYAILLSCVL